MKTIKITIDLLTWHLLPYKRTNILQGGIYKQYGWLCFKLVIGNYKEYE